MAAKGTITVGRLDTVARVRKEAARLYGEARRGRLDPADATRFAQVLQLIARLLEGSELERRIARLEEAARDHPEPWKTSP